MVGVPSSGETGVVGWRGHIPGRFSRVEFPEGRSFESDDWVVSVSFSQSYEL